jgi:hypothetical protein
MKRTAYRVIVLVLALPVALAVVLCTAAPATAAPAWGGSCLSCHAQVSPSPLAVVRADALADPDESFTGAPDRGPLPVFYGFRGRTNRLEAEVVGLEPNDAYAVQLTRLRYRGVESGGRLSYFPDCNWPEWGDTAAYYTDPEISYHWGTGPTQFTFNLDVEPNADRDYYDLVLAVAGKFASDGTLFYGEQHFYLQALQPGDIDGDGATGWWDFFFVSTAIGGPDVTELPPHCDPLTFSLADLDDDGDVDLMDIALFQVAYGGP